MTKCPNCGLEVEIGMKFCGECGTQIPQTKECPACHEQLPLSMKFCGNCGYNFNAASSGTGSVIGDKNVIAGDVHIDQSSTVNNNTVNNITNTTNNVVNNVINQDDTKKVVQCTVCGKQLPVVESCVCSSCEGYVCKDHFNISTQLCDTCVAAKAQKNEEGFKKYLIDTFEANKDLVDTELLFKIDKQRGLFGMSPDGVLDSLTYWDDENDECCPIADGIESWFFKVSQLSSRVELRHYLGRCYQNGIGLPDGRVSDIENAAKIYQEAAKRGDKISESLLSELNPKRVFFRIKPKSFVEVGTSEIEGVSCAYGMKLDERKRFRAIPQHHAKYMMPIMKDMAVEVEEKPLLIDCSTPKTLSFSEADFEHENGDLFALDDFDYGDDGETTHLIVAKYYEGGDFFASAVVSGEFDASKLTLCTETYDDNYSRDPSIDGAAMIARLGPYVTMLRCLDYEGEEIAVHASGYCENCDTFMRTSHLFTASGYDWEYNIFSDNENLRRVQIDITGPGIDVRGLRATSSRLKDMTKYDITSWDDIWNSFTSTKLILDSAVVRVADAYSGEVLYEGALPAGAMLVEKPAIKDFKNEILFTNGSPEACGVSVIFDRKFTYQRTLTCSYTGSFAPSMLEIPWFEFTVFGEECPRRIACDVQDFKLNGITFAFDSNDEETGEPMDIVDFRAWIQYADRQEPWCVLTLEDALVLQEKSKK